MCTPGPLLARVTKMRAVLISEHYTRHASSQASNQNTGGTLARIRVALAKFYTVPPTNRGNDAEPRRPLVSRLRTLLLVFLGFACLVYAQADRLIEWPLVRAE